MSNLLTPPDLVSKRAYSQWGSPNTPKAFSDPMPHRIGARIETEKGIRRLMKDKLARGLGIQKGAEEGLAAHSLHQSTSLFHWEYLSYLMERLKDHGTPGSDHGPRPTSTPMRNPPLPSPRTRRSSHGAPPPCWIVAPATYR
ncbi:unnamed protein product [Cylindrotheca closterium]|uniref:Uncharacterized protein n=1 Tax=Cylindrotheca closterium TaxID=2856 RepID=A0AAD2FHJ8_9STRA|nr:unnamed protein product [Cylindrotheca closterium]